LWFQDGNTQLFAGGCRSKLIELTYVITDGPNLTRIDLSHALLGIAGARNTHSHSLAPLGSP